MAMKTYRALLAEHFQLGKSVPTAELLATFRGALTVSPSEKARFARAFGLAETATVREIVAAVESAMTLEETGRPTLAPRSSSSSSTIIDSRRELAELINSAMELDPSLTWNAAYQKVAAQHVELTERVREAYRNSAFTLKAPPPMPSASRELPELDSDRTDPRLRLHERIVAEMSASGREYRDALAAVKTTESGRELVEEVAAYWAQLMGR